MPRTNLVNVEAVGEVGDSFAWYWDGEQLVEIKIEREQSDTSKLAVYCQWPEDEHPG